MGGSGGGGSYSPPAGGGGSGGGGSPDRDPCALRFEATLSGPNSDYLDQLTMGAILGLRLGGPKGLTIEVVSATNYVLGSLIGILEAGELLDCMTQGNMYQAQVVSRVSGTIKLLVSRSAKP